MGGEGGEYKIMENSKGIIDLIIKYIQIDIVKNVIEMTSTTNK